MGKKIDRFVLTSILAAGLFLYFEAAFQNHILAIALALLCCITILKTLRRLSRLIMKTGWQQRRKLRRQSGSFLMEIACMDTEKAQAILKKLIEGCYNDDAPIAFEPLHPSTQLGQATIFKTWREYRGNEKLIVCTTGRCPSDAQMFASTLKGPRLAIIDGNTLSQLIIENPEIRSTVQPVTRKNTMRFNRISQVIFNRRNAPQALVFSGSMAVMYVFSGNIAYLCASLFLLFAVLVSLRRVSRPAKLF